MITQITSSRYASPSAAHDAMVLTGMAGNGARCVHNLVPGVDAVLYQTTFYPPDGPNDWTCTFAKADATVNVKTDQTHTSFDAKTVAELIAPKF